MLVVLFFLFFCFVNLNYPLVFVKARSVHVMSLLNRRLSSAILPHNLSPVCTLRRRLRYHIAAATAAGPFFYRSPELFLLPPDKFLSFQSLSDTNSL